MTTLIWDSLAHPTVDGFWISKGLRAEIDPLVRDLQTYDFEGACAVGLPNLGAYDHENFWKMCSPFAQLYPVAALTQLQESEFIKEIRLLREIGYRAIKVHQRLLGTNFNSTQLGKIFHEAHVNDFVVFYCTYYHNRISEYPAYDPLQTLIAAFKKAPACRVVLIHGGTVDILRYAELVRFNSNLLLDLSLTMFKYRGSSLDADIHFLIQNFDEKICIGTDHPEYTHPHLRHWFDTVTAGLPDDKACNIASLNLKRFLQIV